LLEREEVIDFKDVSFYDSEKNNLVSPIEFTLLKNEVYSIISEKRIYK